MKDAAFACRPLAVLVTGAAAALPFAADAKVPLVPGDAFHYAFTSDSTIDEPGRAPGHSSATGTFSVTDSGGASFGGRKNLTKLHYSFTETAFANGSYRWSEDLPFTTGNVRGTGSVASDGSAKLTSSLPATTPGRPRTERLWRGKPGSRSP